MHYSFRNEIPVSLAVNFGFLSDGQPHLPFHHQPPLSAVRVGRDNAYGVDIEKNHLLIFALDGPASYSFQRCIDFWKFSDYSWI